MSATQPSDDDGAPKQEGIDWVLVLYILGGIPAIAGFIIGLFFLVNLFPRIPA